MISARNTTTLKGVAAVDYRNASAVLKGIASIKVRNASNVLKTVFSAGGAGIFAVDVPPVAYGAANSATNVSITTEFATATASNGTAPYSYLWERTDSSPEVWIAISPNASSTQFRATSVPATETWAAAFSCTVTDANGQTVTSIDVNVTVQNFGGF